MDQYLIFCSDDLPIREGGMFRIDSGIWFNANLSQKQARYPGLQDSVGVTVVGYLPLLVSGLRRCMSKPSPGSRFLNFIIVLTRVCGLPTLNMQACMVGRIERWLTVGFSRRL